MKHTVLATLGLLFVAAQGCATTAPAAINPSLASAVRVGAQDRAEVLRWFGTPEDVVTPRRPGGRCVETWHWSNPTSTTYENLAVSFDAQGRVCARYYSGSARLRVRRDLEVAPEGPRTAATSLRASR